MKDAILWDYNFEDDSYARNDETIGYEQTELSKSVFVELFGQNGFQVIIPGLFEPPVRTIMVS